MYRGFHVWGEENRGFPDTVCVGSAFNHQGVES